MRNALTYLGILVLVAIVGLSINRAFTLSKENTTSMATPTFALTSSAFKEGESIPSIYTCDGTQVSPPLSISAAPEGTKSFALIVEDQDVPKQIKPDGVFLHWVLFNIPGSLTEITEGAQVGTAGANGAGKNGYAGPCPPPQYEPSQHRYVFTLYALDKDLPLKAGASKESVVKSMQGHVVAQTSLIGTYKKK